MLMMTGGEGEGDGLDLEVYATPQELSDAVDDQTLQAALDTIGLRSEAGASPLDKAKLLFLTKYLPLEDIPERYWAEPKGGKGEAADVSRGTTEKTDDDNATINATSTDIITTDAADEDIGMDAIASGEEEETSLEAINKSEANATDVDMSIEAAESEPAVTSSDDDESRPDTDTNSNSDGIDLDLAPYDSYQQLCEAVETDVLRAELQRIGLKSAGTSMDMAKRLFITKYFPIDQIPEHYWDNGAAATEEQMDDAVEGDSAVQVGGEEVNTATTDDDDDEVRRLEEEQRLLEKELEAVEARIGNTVEADLGADSSAGREEMATEEADQSPTKVPEAPEIVEQQSQTTDLPDVSAMSGNLQIAAAAKEQTERQRLEVERIKAERIAAEEEAAAIRREKERITAQQELEEEEQDEEENDDIEIEAVENNEEEEVGGVEDNNVLIDQAAPEAEMIESFEIGEDVEEAVEEERIDELDFSGLPLSSTLPSSNPFIGPPSPEEASKEGSPLLDDLSDNPLAEEEATKEDTFRFEADRIRAEQEAKRQELARERTEASTSVSTSDADIEKSSEPSIFSRITSAAVGTIGLGALAVGGSLLLDGIESTNEVQPVPSASAPVAEVVTSPDTAKRIPDASISARPSSDKSTESPSVGLEDTSTSSVPAEEPPLSSSASDVKMKAQSDALPIDTESGDNEDLPTASVPTSTSEDQAEGSAPTTEVLAPSSSASDAKTTQEPGNLSPQTESEAPLSPSPQLQSQPQQQQKTSDFTEVITSKSEIFQEERSEPIVAQAQKADNAETEKVNIGEFELPSFDLPSFKGPPIELPALDLPSFKAPSIDKVLPSLEKIKGIASDVDFSDGAKIAGIASAVALGAIGVAVQGKGDTEVVSDKERAAIKVDTIGSAMNVTNTTTSGLPKSPITANKTSAPCFIPTNNGTAQRVEDNAIAKESAGFSSKASVESSKPTTMTPDVSSTKASEPKSSQVSSSARPVSPSSLSDQFGNTGGKDEAGGNPPTSSMSGSFPRAAQSTSASARGPKAKAATEPIDAEIISSKTGAADGDESIEKVLKEASEAAAGAEAALKNKAVTNTTSNSSTDNVASEEDQRIAAELKAAKERMEAERMERIDKVKDAEAQFLDQERKEAAEKAKQKRVEAEKRIADAKDAIRIEQARDQKVTVSNPSKPPLEMDGASRNSSPSFVSPRPAGETLPRQTIDNNWFNEQLRRQEMEQKSGPSPFEKIRKLADGTEIPPDTSRRTSPYAAGLDGSAGDGVLSASEYAISAFLAAFVGIWAAFPILGLHYLVFSDYTYTTFAQWEWELIAASVQSSCFGILYRYALRTDVDNSGLQRIVVLAAVFLKSVIRVNVPYVCAGGDLADGRLFCSESPPLFILNDAMVTDLVLNGLEGLAMFGAVAISMNWLTERRRR